MGRRIKELLVSNIDSGCRLFHLDPGCRIEIQSTLTATSVNDDAVREFDDAKVYLWRQRFRELYSYYVAILVGACVHGNCESKRKHDFKFRRRVLQFDSRVLGDRIPVR